MNDRPRRPSLRAAHGLPCLAILALATLGACSPRQVGPGRGHVDSLPHRASSTATESAADANRFMAGVALDQLDPARESGRPLTFVSAESTFASGIRIENRIRTASSKRFDLWLMRQRHGDTDARDPFMWSFVAIVVDKIVPEGARFRARYFEFARSPISPGTQPARAAMTAPCLGCHASGPRLIRPTRGTLNTLTASEANILALYNQTIRGYGNVENVTVEGVMPRVAAATERAPLSLPRCAGCHFDGSRVRAPLYPWQANTIGFMVSEHENVRPMPPRGPKLSLDERAVLERWSEPKGNVSNQ